MMDFATWKNALLPVIEVIGDPSFQHRVWLHGDNTVFSSWEEVYCQLFDDMDIDGFIQEFCMDLSREGCRELRVFRDALQQYGELVGSNVDVRALLIDPKWHRVCGLARNAFSAINSKGPG